MATINGPGTYFEDRFGYSGFEYELAELFAESLGLLLEVIAEEETSTIYQTINAGKANFAAAGLQAQDKKSSRFIYSRGYQSISQKLIYKKGRERPESFIDIKDNEIIALSKLAHKNLLKSGKDIPTFIWLAKKDLDAVDMLKLVDEEISKFTLVNSTDWNTFKHVFPQLGTAFDINRGNQISWLFSRKTDSSLYDLAEVFLKQAKHDGTIELLLAKHFNHLNNLNYASAKIFLRHVEQRLPKYEQSFRIAAKHHGIDWRLLAAMSYQESQWNEKAISPTGVRGLMMLTKATAHELGVSDRLDPYQSIFGGAEYFKKLFNRLPKDMPDEHKNWQALAAYNAGWGHLLDARRFARHANENQNDWYTVKKYLPKLQQKRWYQKSIYGYAPGGRQSLHYVKNIRLYYAALVFTTRKQGMTKVSFNPTSALKNPLQRKLLQQHSLRKTFSKKNSIHISKGLANNI